MKSLQRSAKLLAWNGDGTHAAVIQRLQLQLDAVCGKAAADAQRAACQKLLPGRIGLSAAGNDQGRVKGGRS